MKSNYRKIAIKQKLSTETTLKTRRNLKSHMSKNANNN